MHQQELEVVRHDEGGEEHGREVGEERRPRVEEAGHQDRQQRVRHDVRRVFVLDHDGGEHAEDGDHAQHERHVLEVHQEFFPEQ